MSKLGINVDKVTVVPNGADLAEYEVEESREELRKEYGISGFTAVFSGTHANYVGLDLIVDAARRLPDVNFLLVGAGARKQCRATGSRQADHFIDDRLQPHLGLCRHAGLRRNPNRRQHAHAQSRRPRRRRKDRPNGSAAGVMAIQSRMAEVAENFSPRTFTITRQPSPGVATPGLASTLSAARNALMEKIKNKG